MAVSAAAVTAKLVALTLSDRNGRTVADKEELSEAVNDIMKEYDERHEDERMLFWSRYESINGVICLGLYW